MAGYRPNYTIQEEKKIVQYILENEAYYSVRGTLIWKDLEKQNTLDRSWMSLKEHYIKKIIPFLNNPALELTKDEISLLREGFMQSSKKRPRSPTRTFNLSAVIDSD